MSELLHSHLTYQIIGAAFEVQKVLGYGFLEKVYENALMEELQRRQIQATKQASIDVYYKGALVGQYVADLVVEGRVIVEIKTGKEFNTTHQVQLLHYLKATGLRVGLLLNVGERKCEFKRLVV